VADGVAPGAGGHAPEDEFDRALRALTEGTAGEARFRELSAAEREKAGAAAGRAARKQAEELARAVRAERKRARRRGRSWDEPTRRRGGRARAVVAVVAAIALVGAGVFALQRFSRPLAGGPDDSHLVTNGPTPTGTAANSPAPVPVAAPGPPADPFAGTPADHWANGAAGIIVPAAAPAGAFSASQVAAAYAVTRKLLIAQNLDQPTLLGGAPDAFAALLTAGQRKFFLAGLNKAGRAKNGAALSTRSWVTSFAPGTTALIGSVIKVHGTMTARAATDHGRKYLAIDVNYRFDYPVEPPRAPADWIRVVGEVSGYIHFDNWQDPGGALQPWMVTALPSHAGARCDTPDGYAHPGYPSGPPDKVQPSGPAQDPYSMATTSPNDEKGCRRVART
jgi:hypothetical protein